MEKDLSGEGTACGRPRVGKSIGIVRGVKSVGGIGGSEGEASQGKQGPDDKRYGMSSSGGGALGFTGWMMGAVKTCQTEWREENTECPGVPGLASGT